MRPTGLPDYANGYFAKNFSWAFVPIDPMNVRTKFEVRIASQIPDMIGGTQKLSAVSGYAHAPSSLKFLKVFSSDASYECTCQI